MTTEIRKKTNLEDDELEDEESKDEESIPGYEEAETVIEQRRTRARSEIETTTEIETSLRRSRRKIVRGRSSLCKRVDNS